MPKHLGNRLARHKKRKKIQQTCLFISIIMTLALLASFILSRYFLPSSPSATTGSPSTAQTQVKQENSRPPASSKEVQSDITWVKQEEPVKIPILMYHAIHVMDPSEVANAGLIVAPDLFESHLKALQEAGYYSLTPEEVYKALSENSLPKDKKVVWLTFDDSLKDFYTQAFPLLKQYQMKATNNVITGFVEQNREDILTLDEIKEMKAAGMSFEDHTVHHPDLSTSSIESQENELGASKEYLDQHLSQTTTTVAYPSGRYTDTTLQIAEKLGYKLGLTTNHGLASASNGLLSLNRIRINPTTSAQNLLEEILTE